MTVTLEINGKRVQVGDEFRSLSPEQQQAQVEEIARSMGMAQEQPSGGATEFLGQAARSLGRFGDLVTAPGQAAGEFLRQAQGFEPSEVPGRAVTQGLVDARIASPNEPDSVVGKAGAGMGDAMAALLPVAGALNQARAAGGVTGAIADDMFRALSTRIGVATEALAGAASGGASGAVEEAGGSETAQSLAGLAAPLSIPAMGAAARGTGALASYMPGVQLVKRGAEGVARAFLPGTEAGARATASNRLRELVGPERAEDVAAEINPLDEFGRTGAQQTGDPNLMGLQNEAALADPAMRERLAARQEQSTESIVDSVRAMGGEVTDARAFFRRRFVQFRNEMNRRIDQVQAEAAEAAEAAGPERTTADNSRQVSEKLNEALSVARDEERALWGAVPNDVTVPTDSIKARAQSLIDSNSKFQSDDVPAVIQQLLSNQVGDTETVGEMHGLYSELRRISRVARAGDTQNRNMARIADGVADAILATFDDLPGSEIAEARAFTRAMNQTFYTGASGRILNQTNQSVSRIAPEAALDATVGRGRAQGGVDARNIANAAPEAAQNVQDFLRSGFSDALTNASGDVSAKSARTWMRRNAEALKDYPELKKEMLEASQTQESAKAYQARLEQRMKVIEGGPAAQFSAKQPESAITAILGAENPITAARQVARIASEDPSGKALAGVKAAFADHLTQDATKLPALLADRKVAGAMSRVFNGREMERLRQIGDAMSKMNVSGQDVGGVMNERNNVILDTVVRVAAAKASAQLGSQNAGVGLQQAQIASSRARDFLNRLTNDKARQLLMDAVEDPELMKALLSENHTQLSERARSKLAPYLVGGVAGLEEDE